MSVSEELRKLQAECKANGQSSFGLYHVAARAAYLTIAEALTKHIALAEAQERELSFANFRRDTWKGQCKARDEIIEALKRERAALKEQKKPTYCLGLETVRKVAKEGQLETDIVDFVAADSLFHEEVFAEAGLREVAEMAIAKCDEIEQAAGYSLNMTADSILREFREKKAEERKKADALIAAAYEACAKECAGYGHICNNKGCHGADVAAIHSLAPEAAREELERIKADARLEGELIGLRFAVENDLICACDLETKPEDLCATHKIIAELSTQAKETR